MKRLILLACICSGIVSPGAAAKEVKDGGLSGKVISASSTLPGATFGQLFEVPTSGRFVLTQVCINGSAQRIEGAYFGDIAFAYLVAGCTTFSPGIALPQGEVLSHVNEQPPASTPRSAMITGVLTKGKPDDD